MAQSSDPSFGRMVVARAWFSAWAFFHSKLRDAVLFACLFVAGGIVYYRFYGFPATKDQVVPVLIFTVGPMVALWVLLFIWHLWLAPAAIAYEAAKTAHSGGTSSAPQKDKPVINWAPWKHRREYTIYEFAKILAKTDPAAQAMNTEGSSFARLIKEDIKNKKLKYVPQYGESFDGLRNHRYELDVDYDSCVIREDALAWAKARGFSVDHIT